MRSLLVWAAAWGLSVQVALAADVVGAATSLRASAQQTPPQQAATELALNASIVRNAQLTTGASGLLHVTFLDDSKLAMGSNASIVVDQFTYGGQGSTGEQALRLGKGAFRFISGAIPKDKVRIETPSVTIGIRGTTLRTLVADDGTTTVGVDDGQAVVVSRQTGQIITLNPGEKVTIKPGGEVGTIMLGKVEGCP